MLDLLQLTSKLQLLLQGTQRRGGPIPFNEWRKGDKRTKTEV